MQNLNRRANITPHFPYFAGVFHAQDYIADLSPVAHCRFC
jgi:hypothetical protein